VFAISGLGVENDVSGVERGVGIESLRNNGLDHGP